MFFVEIRNNSIFFHIRYQMNSVTSLHSESEKGFDMQAPLSPFVGIVASPFFLVCAAARTFLAREGTPASTRKDALSLREVHLVRLMATQNFAHS